MANMPARSVHDARAPNSRPARRLRICVADDDGDTIASLAAILRDEGHDVYTASRGDLLLDLCLTVQPEVVITDIELPGANGYAIARELRQRDGVLAPLLVAISGKWTETSDKLLGHALGFDHYLLKPADPRELLAILGSRDTADNAELTPNPLALRTGSAV
jgi:two-component system OmpR family response regulator